MIRMLATTALGLVLANAALAQSPSTNSKSEQTPQSQSNTASQPTTPAPGATDSQRSTPSSQSSPGASTQNTQTSQPSSGSANNSSGSPNSTNSADSSRPQGGATNSNNTAGNPPASQQGANPPATNTNQAQDRTNPPASAPSNNANQAQQAPSATGTNQAQSPNASGTNQAQGERAGTNTASRTDVNLNRQQETRISASISHLNVRPLTNVNFSLNVGTVVPRDVQLSTLPPDVVEIVPQYRGYSFALVKDQIVVVDPATYKIVTVLPYSGQSTATTTTRERSASKFSDRDREVIRKHAKTRTEGREARTTGSTARTEFHVGDRVPDTVEVEEFPSTVYQDAPDLREYRYIHRDTRTYVIEPSERRVIEEID